MVRLPTLRARALISLGTSIMACSWVRVAALAALAGDLGPEGVEALGPEGAELAHPGVHLLERSGVHGIQAAGAVGAHAGETAVPQHPQVL